MKSSCLLTIVFLATAVAQTPPASAPSPQPVPPAPQAPAPDTVIATVDGTKLTYGEVANFLKGMNPQMQQNAMRNRKDFVERYALMRRLSTLAEQAKLGERSPYKEAIESYRMNMLMQAEINEYVDHIVITADDLQKYYDENKSRYDQVKLKVIYIPFSSAPAGAAAEGKKHLTEEEAKAKAERLIKEIKGGADFVKLVKENSEDASSKAKDGDMGTLSRADNLPESIRSVVFALKAGEVSEPVRQPNGFYIFRADEVSQRPLEQVREQLVKQLQSERLQEWLKSTTKSLNIKFENEQFFSGAAAAETQSAPPPNK
jgi:peptidyl-prolyl cis-trans isomerase C